jgi:hypothetical protein
MDIKKFLLKGSLTVASMLIFALPALPNQLSFSFETGNIGTDSLTGGMGTYALSALTLNVTGWTDSGLPSGSTSGLASGTTFLKLTNVGANNLDTFELFSTLTIDGVTSSQANPLLAFTASTTVNSGGTNVAFGPGGSVTALNSTFGTSVGVTSSSSVTIPGGEAASLSSGTVGSATMNPVFTSTPEPASFLLFGAGLIGATLLARRRASATPTA